MGGGGTQKHWQLKIKVQKTRETKVELFEEWLMNLTKYGMMKCDTQSFINSEQEILIIVHQIFLNKFPRHEPGFFSE